MNQSTRTCCMCDSSIDHLRSIAKYCSGACAERSRSLRDPSRRSAHAKERKRAESAQLIGRSCASRDCDAQLPAGSSPSRLYCTTKCRDARYRTEVHSVRYAKGAGLYEHHRKLSADWKRNNAVSNRLSRALREARKRGTTVAPITAEQLDARLAFFGYRCWMCGGPWEHIDHVKPLSKGGPHILANLRPSCGPCNQSKNATWPFASTR